MRYSQADTRAMLRAMRTGDEHALYHVALIHDPCVYCGVLVTDTDVPFHLDHIDPVHFDGGYGWDNIAPACRTCNLRKRTRTLLSHLLCESYEYDLWQARLAGRIGRA